MQQRSKAIVQIADPALAVLSLFISYLIFWQHSPYTRATPFTTQRSIQDFCALALLAFCWHGLFSIVGLYRPRLTSFFTVEAGQLLRAMAVFPLPVLVCWLLTRQQRHSNLTQAVEMAVLGALLLPFAMAAARVLFTTFKRYLWYGNTQLRQVLVVGTNQRAMKFVHDSLRNPDCGFTCVSFVDDAWFCPVPEEQSPIRLDGKISDLPFLLRQRAIDEVVIALPMASFYQRSASIISLCETLGIRVRIIGQLFETHFSKPTLATTEVSSMITVHDPAWSEVSAFIKRFFDVMVSGLLLTVCLPVFCVIGAAIALSSEGPIFFRQTRLGLGKRHFRIFKFRTMVANASEMIKNLEHLNETAGPTFKLKQDPRVTRVGAFLRKTSLDELPQLINVLVGHMSMVGPRPLPLRDYEGFSEDRHRRRFSVKPGITCLWQIMGRSSIKFDQWMALDSQYIDQRTFWLDIKILAQTIPAVLRGSGAM